MKRIQSRTSSRLTRSHLGRDRGFSLVELMVGVGVGLLSTVVIATILANSEQQKRSTMMGGDAQVAGSLALYQLEAAVREAGYGLTSDTAGTGCTLVARYGGAVLADAPTSLAPVVITPASAGVMPSVRVTRSLTSSFALPAQVEAPLFNPAGAGTVATTVVVRSTLGMSAGDLLAVVSAPVDATKGVGTCNVFQVSALAADNISITRTTDAGWNGVADLAALSAGQYVVNLGSLETTTFSVGPIAAGSPIHALQLTRYNLKDRTLTNQVLQNGVVDMKAFYGSDSDDDGVVDSYDTTTPTTVQGWQRVRSLRVAVLTRSDQFEKDKVTTTEPLWDVGKSATVSGAVDCGSSKCILMSPKVSTDWEHYRYKVFDVVIPLRNQVWRSDLPSPT